MPEIIDYKLLNAFDDNMNLVIKVLAEGLRKFYEFQEHEMLLHILKNCASE